MSANCPPLEQLERLVPPWTTLGSRLATLTFLQHDLGRRSPWRRFLELRRSIDAICVLMKSHWLRSISDKK